MAVPKLRFREFSNLWTRVVLGELATNVDYGLNSSAIEFDGKHKYIRITDIDDVSHKYKPNPLTTPNGKLDENYRLQEGDIVFARTGASVGKSYLYDENDGLLFFAGFLIRFSFSKEEINSYFIFLNTLTKKYQNWIKTNSMRSGQPGINAEQYRHFSFYLPDMQEQTKIANFLSTVDKKIDVLSQQLEQLTQYKKGMMQKLFSQQIRFKDDGNEYPEWEYKELFEIGKKITRKNKDSSVVNVLTNSATQGIILQSTYFDRSITTESNLNNYSVIELNDFVYNPRISVHAPVGPINMNECGRGIMSPLYTVFHINDGNLFFYKYFFQGCLWHDYIKSVANSGARHDRMNITSLDFLGMLLPSPSLKEQTKIANFLTSIDKKITTVQQQLDQMHEWKKGLLQQMFI